MSQRPRHILTSSDEETEGNPEVEVVAAETGREAKIGLDHKFRR